MKVIELLESEAPILFDDFVEDNCRQYMEALDADLPVIMSPRFSLYRGLKRSSLPEPMKMAFDGELVNAYVKSVREDRQPLDTSLAITKLVDDVLEEKFGWRPRTQGVFCYTFKYRGGADSYGMRCKIYPMGPLEFVYSPRIKDMTPEISRWIRDQGLRHISKGESISSDNMEAYKFAVRSFIDQFGYTNDNLHKAMMAEGKPEIMVRCKKYLAISSSMNEEKK